MKSVRLCELKTPFEGMEGAWAREYPRPQLVRDSYFPLSEGWELSIKSRDAVIQLGEVKIPFAPESRLSGIKRTLKNDEKWVYTCRFILPDGFNRGRMLLHFGAVDQITYVSVNGMVVGAHIGGYLPFEYDITDYIYEGENTLTVEVTDSLNTDIPYGKQSRHRGGMWYTPISGIWQTVWLESVVENYISSLRIKPALDSVIIETAGGESQKTISVETPNGIVEHTYSGDTVTLEIESPRLWSPEDPYLYYFTLTDGNDTLRSYFALRTVSIKKYGKRKYICLNDKPYFFHGLLDQGYYSDGIYLPASPDGYLWDIKTMKSLGFNTLRKHIKIEPDIFYHYCDKYGIIVFQDMVNSGRYSFMLDTALPTIGVKRGIWHSASEHRREIFERSCDETVDILYNHPCVCYYTIFNEGWGQYSSTLMYKKLKSRDASRVLDSTSGWFYGFKSDVRSEHVYFRKIKLKASKKPLILSEFGGYSCKTDGHVFNLDKAYGYRTMADTAELNKSLRSLYLDEVIPMISRGLNASILTQASDVEDEINGLVTYDRQFVKADPVIMNEIRDAIDKAFLKEFT